MKRFVIAALAAAMMAVTPAAASAQESGVYVLPKRFTGGGSQRRHLDRAWKLHLSGKQIQIRHNIFSASTYYLMIHNICVAPDIVAKFHGPMNNFASAVSIAVFVPLAGRGYSNREHARVTDIIAKDFNNAWPGLGDAYLKHAAKLYHVRTWNKTGQELHDEFAIPLCD